MSGRRRRDAGVFRPDCSVSERPAPRYDMLPPRRFEFIPFWGILVFFVYSVRGVNGPRCGVKAERVPWADGKSPICTDQPVFETYSHDSVFPAGVREIDR